MGRRHVSLPSRRTRGHIGTCGKDIAVNRNSNRCNAASGVCGNGDVNATINCGSVNGELIATIGGVGVLVPVLEVEVVPVLVVPGLEVEVVPVEVVPVLVVPILVVPVLVCRYWSGRY